MDGNTTVLKKRFARGAGLVVSSIHPEKEQNGPGGWDRQFKFILMLQLYLG